MYKIGIIYNPLAGSNKHNSSERSSQLGKILGNHGVLRETRSLEELNKVAREFYEEKLEILAICGGDGTTQRVLTAFEKIYREEGFPLVALLKGGTMNLLEHSLGMKGDPVQRLQNLIKIAEKGKYPTISHTLLRVNSQCGWIFGNGMPANFLEEYYRSGTPSFQQAISTFSTAFWSTITGHKNYIEQLFTPVHAEVQVGDVKLPDTCFTALMAATEKECGFGFKPFYQARKEQGKFHFLALNLQPKELLQNLHKFRAGQKVVDDTNCNAVTNHVMIETAVPYHYTIDGEMLNTTKKIEISAGPVVKLIAM